MRAAVIQYALAGYACSAMAHQRGQALLERVLVEPSFARARMQSEVRGIMVRGARQTWSDGLSSAAFRSSTRRSRRDSRPLCLRRRPGTRGRLQTVFAGHVAREDQDRRRMLAKAQPLRSAIHSPQRTAEVLQIPYPPTDAISYPKMMSSESYRARPPRFARLNAERLRRTHLSCSSSCST